MMKVLIAGLVAVNCLFAAERPTVLKDWRISGTFVNKIGKNSVDAWQLVRINENSVEVVRYNKRQIKLDVVEGSKFQISPTLGTILSGRFVLGICAANQVGFSDPFELTAERPIVADLQIKLSIPPIKNLVCKGVLLDPDTLQSVADTELIVCLHDTSLPVALEGLEISKVKSGPKGIFSIDSLPALGIQVFPKEGRYRVALKSGDMIKGNFQLIPKPEDAPELMNNTILPNVYLAPKGKGCIWHNFTEVASGVPLMSGTVLRFSAKRNTNDESTWNPNLKFEVIVGEGGIVKTPLVPEGEYSIVATKGTPFTYDYTIEGMGSIHLMEAVQAKRDRDQKK